jgi:tetratricopeptide (TPR) repeat protein
LEEIHDPKEDHGQAVTEPDSFALLRSDWTAEFFSWDDPCDPRTNLVAWRALARQTEARKVRLSALFLDYQMGGPRDLRLSDELTQRGPAIDYFGMVATTTLSLPQGSYLLRTTSDDGVRVRVNEKVVLENWAWHGPTIDEAVFEVSGEGPVVVEVEHFEIDGYSTLTVELEPSPGLMKSVSQSDWLGVSRQLKWRKQQDEDNHWPWFLCLVVDGYLNATTNRLEIAKSMLDRFENESAPEVAERLAKAVLFRAPPAGSELIERAGMLADRAMKSDPTYARFPYFQCAKALAEHRQGHWAAAVQFAEETLKSAGAVPARDAQAEALLAMARYRLGQPEAAREALAKARDLLPESLLAEGKIPPKLADGDWHDLLIAKVLIGEANGVLESE